MLIETDVTGIAVLVVGPADVTVAAARRWTRAGAQVVSVPECAAITPAQREWAGVAVLVGDAAQDPQRGRSLTGVAVVVTEPAPDPVRGRVVLVGAGPGGAGLMTLDGLRALAEADVVLTDRLAEIGDLAAFAPGAEIVDVGKTPGHHAVPQAQIEALMVERAQQGLTVVRLKGGDPYVFGRGGEEVAAAVAAGLHVTVVPGVSSAVAVPGSAGIPVTHRGVSHLVTVVSGHVPLEDHRARALAELGGTVVVLMGMQNLVTIAAALERGGLDPETPAAVVERGFTPDQRSIVGTLGTLAGLVERGSVASPAVIVVGEVVRQSHVWSGRAGAPRAEVVA